MDLKLLKKIYPINKWVRLWAMGANIIVLGLMIIMLFSTMTRNKFMDQKVSLYSYSNKGEVNYKVHMKPNTIYEQEMLDEGGTYITDFIDYINSTLKYEFKGEKPLDLKGKYNVVAIVEGTINTEKGKKSIWKKEKTILKETSFNTKDSTVLIEKEIPFEISEYNDYVRQVIQESNIGFETKLTIVYNISIEGITGNGTIKEQLSPKLEIPLNSKFFEIQGNTLVEENKSIEEDVRVIVPNYYIKIIVCTLIILLGTATLIFLLYFTSPKPESDDIKKKLKNIIKKHGDRLVSVLNELDEKGESIFIVKTIEDLVRISDDLAKPMLWNTENIVNKPVFWVIDGSNVFLYKVEENNFKSKITET